MVFSFFRGGDDAIQQADNEILAMIGDCRHSLDLALSALTAAGDITSLGEEIRETDHRINTREEKVRRDLVVHGAVHGGSADVGAVLSAALVVKKLERMGDQAKNIFDLADEGVRFTGAEDEQHLRDLGVETSNRLGKGAAILANPDPEKAATFIEACYARMHDLDQRVNELMHSDLPGLHAVP